MNGRVKYPSLCFTGSAFMELLRNRRGGSSTGDVEKIPQGHSKDIRGAANATVNKDFDLT